MIGTNIANYRVLEVLGEGGMGVVYKAVDVNLERTVAVKVLASELSRDPGLIERFQAEAKAQASLNHTNIATLYNFLNVDGSWLIVMEYVEGENLEQMIQRNGVLQAQDAVPLFKQALAGVGFAHRFGIVHRDIKPANIMVNRHGIVKVMDFGIAKALSGRKLTRTGVAVGTVAYMSPEQIRNQGVDLRSDIYSLGVMLYQMLTAHLPFDSESDFQVQYDHVNTPPPPLSLHYPYVPAAVEAAVLRAMEKDPNRRFRTVEEFSAALEHLDVAPAPYFAAGAGAQTAPQPAIRPSSPNAPVGNMGVTAQPTPYPAHRSATLIERPTFTGAAPTQQTTAAQPAATPPPPAARSSRSGMIVGVAGLALAAVIGVGIWKWSNRKETPPTQTQATNSPAPNTSPQTPAVAPQQQPATTTATPPSPQPDIKHPTTALNVPLPKVEAPSKERKTTTPIEKPAPQPAQPDPGMLALQKSQQLMSTQQLLDPFGNSALSWAIQATQAGNPQGPEMESRIQTQIHDRFEQYLNAKAFPQANILVSSIERYYRPNTFEAWRTELQNSQHAALPVSPPPPTPVTAPQNATSANGHTYPVAHRHLNKGNNPFVKVNQDPPEWYYVGNLTVAPDGSVTFRCTSVSLREKPCEADIEIPAGQIKNVKAGDFLHFEAAGHNYDFKANNGNILASIRNDITNASKAK